MIATQLSYLDRNARVIGATSQHNAQSCSIGFRPRCIAPANWRDVLPWCDDYRTVNGVRVRSAGPLYYQDADGVVWRKKRGLEWEYEEWSR